MTTSPGLVFDEALSTLLRPGNRYELIDGMLLVSPIPGLGHQIAVSELGIRLHAACPPGLHVLLGPFAVRPCEATEVQPDLLVARTADFTQHDLPVAPLLAVEVAMGSSILADRTLKKALFERIGTPSYWLVDPLARRLVAFEIDEGGRYQQVADIKGDKVFEATRPFPVRVVPSELFDEDLPLT